MTFAVEAQDFFVVVLFFAAVRFSAALLFLADVPLDFFAVDRLLLAEALLVLRDAGLAVDRDRFPSLPIGSALPTAFIAPLATSPTVPATSPAVLPICLTTLPASGIARPPYVRPVIGRSSGHPCRRRAAWG